MCLANPDNLYILYLPHGGTTTLNFKLDHDPKPARYTAQWFNPRTGKFSAIPTSAEAPTWTTPESPDKEDWAILLQKTPGAP